MALERIAGGVCADPFPVYAELVASLAAAHVRAPLERDPLVAHVLGTCAGYAYGDTEMLSTVATRLGLPSHVCVRISQAVDAMLIYTTAYLLQSQCGRVVLLCYRGTETANLGNWLGDSDVGPDSTTLVTGGGRKLRVHGGFHRNLRATWWAVMQELAAALEGRSLANHQLSTPRPMEALYVCGHSAGGALALLFGLKLAGDPHHRGIAERLRAVYTYGQPLALLGPLPDGIDTLARGVFRHVVLQDPIPALPAATWGPFVHVGQEFRYVEGEWRRSEAPVAQLKNMRSVPHIVLSFFETEERRAGERYAFGGHAPQQYFAALRPAGRVTEFGDSAET